jgi:hypothetical protein
MAAGRPRGGGHGWRARAAGPAGVAAAAWCAEAGECSCSALDNNKGTYPCGNATWLHAAARCRVGSICTRARRHMSHDCHFQTVRSPRLVLGSDGTWAELSFSSSAAKSVFPQGVPLCCRL